MTEILKPRWYVVHVYSGSEDKVIREIRERAEKKGLAEGFLELLAPKEEKVEVKRGVKKDVQKSFFPGYILVKMLLTDETRHLVHNIDRVSGFLGGKDRPSPMSEKEVARLKGAVEESREQPQQEISFMVGEYVSVVGGPFKGLRGMIDVISDKNRLKVLADVFGRQTPIEVDFADVEKE